MEKAAKPTLSPEILATGVAFRYMDGKVVSVPTRFLKPHPDQPRKFFDPQAMAELVEDIRYNGILNPLLVMEQGADLLLLSGERRWRAAQELGLEEVPCVIIHNDARASEWMFSANKQQRLQVFERNWYLWKAMHKILQAFQPTTGFAETGEILRYLHNPKGARVQPGRIPDWVLQRYASLKEDLEVVLRSMGSSLEEVATFIAAWEGLHPLVQEALEGGQTYWRAARLLNPWIRQLRRELGPDHPEASEESLREFIRQMGREGYPRLAEIVKEEAQRLLEGGARQKLPPRKNGFQRIVKRWWKKSSLMPDMDQRDELHRLLKEVEARVAEVEAFLREKGVDPWA